MIKILNLPEDLNIDKRIEKKMLEVYGICPYCNNNHLLEGDPDDSSSHFYSKYVVYHIYSAGYGPIDKKTFIFKKKYEHKKMIFHCNKCGMKWESPKYPILGNDTDANTAIFHAWQEGKNMEINTLLLTTLKENENI